MLVAIDLGARQTARILTQAVKARAKLEIEPRPEACSELLWGTLTSREDDTLMVELHDGAAQRPLNALLGAMCDVRTILSDQLCMFSTFILDASSHTVPQRITLAVPDSVQLANRRRHVRRSPIEPVTLRLTVPESSTPFVAILSNIGPIGLACRSVSRELDDVLFIGDEIQLQFALPWSSEMFTLPATVCNKNSVGEPGHMLIGLEYVDQANHDTLERLRAVINDEAARLTQMDGDA